MNSSIKNGDWNSVRQALQAIENRLGEAASPVWPGLTITDLTVTNDLTVGNDIIVGGLVDGRDIAADGIVLDDVEKRTNHARMFYLGNL